MNERVFEELVRKHEVALTTFARSQSRDRWSTEEAVQETLVRAWQYLDTFDRHGSFEGWLLRICRNVVIDQASAAARRPTTIESHELDRLVQPRENDATLELIDLLHHLSVDHREVLVIVGVLGLSYEEAASSLDVPIGTVRSRLGRARQAFGELLVDAPLGSLGHGAA